jgi:hypothetical protein
VCSPNLAFLAGHGYLGRAPVKAQYFDLALSLGELCC